MIKILCNLWILKVTQFLIMGVNLIVDPIKSLVPDKLLPISLKYRKIKERKKLKKKGKSQNHFFVPIKED